MPDFKDELENSYFSEVIDDARQEEKHMKELEYEDKRIERAITDFVEAVKRDMKIASRKARPRDQYYYRFHTHVSLQLSDITHFSVADDGWDVGDYIYYLSTSKNSLKRILQSVIPLLKEDGIVFGSSDRDGCSWSDAYWYFKRYLKKKYPDNRASAVFTFYITAIV